MKEAIIYILDKYNSWQITEAAPVKWIIDHQKYIAWLLYALFFAGCAYWYYRFTLIDAGPWTNLVFRTSETREALVFIVFGIFGAITGGIIVFFLFKLISNLVIDGISDLIPGISRSIVKSISCLTLLGITFIFLGNIKAAGLTAYHQVGSLIHVARQHDEVTAENYKRKIEIERQAERGILDGFLNN